MPKHIQVLVDGVVKYEGDPENYQITEGPDCFKLEVGEPKPNAVAQAIQQAMAAGVKPKRVNGRVQKADTTPVV